MLTTMIANLDQITPDWLTAALGETFAGRTITSIEQAVNPAFNSRIAHLTVRFAGDLPDLLSTRLLVKLNGEDDGRTEVGFYQAMIALPSVKRARLPMIVTCYGAEYDPTSLRLARLAGNCGRPVEVVSGMSCRCYSPTYCGVRPPGVSQTRHSCTASLVSLPGTLPCLCGTTRRPSSADSAPRLVLPGNVTSHGVTRRDFMERPHGCRDCHISPRPMIPTRHSAPMRHRRYASQ